MDNSVSAHLGLDVSKAKLDCALLLNGKAKSKVFSNDPEGFLKLSAWLLKQKVIRVHACCEATGVYNEAIALYLHRQGHVVSVVNPAQIAAYGQSQLSRAKTDALDASLIARFCEREQPPAWTPPPPEERALLALVRDLRELQAIERAEANRSGTAHEAVRGRIEQHLVFLAGQIDELRKKIAQHIDSNDDLRDRRDFLDSIPGLGDGTIPWLIACLGDGSRFERSNCLAAHIGGCPKPRESGSSIRGKAFAPFVQRLKGKPPKVIIVALMRKLITIAYAVIKSGKLFDISLHHA